MLIVVRIGVKTQPSAEFFYDHFYLNVSFQIVTEQLLIVKQ